MSQATENQPKWRPTKGGIVVLDDATLAKIGLMTVYEGTAKHTVAAAVSVVGQTNKDWVQLEKLPLRDLMELLIAGAAKGSDEELRTRVGELEKARDSGHLKRHQVVHSPWGEGGDGQPFAYDFRRKKELTLADIDAALDACAELRRASAWMILRLAELIEDGIYPEGEADGSGLGIHTKNRLVRI